MSAVYFYDQNLQIYVTILKVIIFFVCTVTTHRYWVNQRADYITSTMNFTVSKLFKNSNINEPLTLLKYLGNP